MVLFVIRGKVRKGKERGKSLGFPTANINLHKKIPTGIYVSVTIVSGKKFPSVSFIGNAKTFNEELVLLETHILSYNKNLYNTWISVHLIKKIRENKKFDTVDKLVLQMEKDKTVAENYFKNNV